MDNSVAKARQAHFWNNDPRLHGIVDNISDSVVCTDIKGYIELFNNSAEHLFGYSTDEVIGRHVKFLIPTNIRNYYSNYLAFYKKQERKHPIKYKQEIKGCHKDGTIFPIHLTVEEVKLSGFHGFIGVVQDLTGSKAAEQLVQKEAFIQAISNSTTSILVKVNYFGYVLYGNTVATKNYSLDSSTGTAKQLFTDLFPLSNITLQDIRQTIDDSKPLTKYRIPQNIQGEIRYTNIMILPLANNLNEALIRIDDVTERIRMEEIMVQTEKMLAVGGLAAGMAHEINNPLGVIAQGCQNLRRRISLDLVENETIAQHLGLDLAKMQEYFKRRHIFKFLDDIQASANRAGSIISDMLDYSRRGASSFVLVRLGNLIDMVLRLAKHDYDLKASYDFRHIKVYREGNENIEIYCDQVAIEQVLLNLLRNSAQAMGTYRQALIKPEITIRISDADNFIKLEISDNGPGMSEEVSQRAFEPFFTTKPVGIGTGLGLSVAYFIITHQHRGAIDLQTTTGKGTSFIIHLPKNNMCYVPNDPHC